DFRGERVELIDHRVDGCLQLQHLALHVDGDLLRQVSVGDGGSDLGDVADLRGQIRRHEVHVVGEVLPDAGHAADVGLAAQLAVGADLAGDAGDLAGEAAQLVDHGVDGVLQLEDLAAGLDGDLLRQIAVRHRRRDLGDVPDLRGQVPKRVVEVAGDVFCGARSGRYFRYGALLI